MKKTLDSVKKVFLIICKVVFFIILGFFALSFITKFCENKYRGPQYEADLYQMIDNYVTAYGNKNASELIHVGNFDHPSKQLMFGVWLRSYASEDLEQGRIRAITFVHDFYKMLLQNKIANTYFEESKRYYPPVSSDKITLKIIGVKIAYWDKNVNRPQVPYLAEITFLNEKFHYYQADPETQVLKLVREETYEDALAKLR